MILDRLENATLYYGVDPTIRRALKYLETGLLQKAAAGLYREGDDTLYYRVSRYQTRDADRTRFEAHRYYVDIQFIAEGAEVFEIANIRSLTESQPYDPATDCIFFSGEAQHQLLVPAGWFLILFPEDAHVACLKNGNQDGMVKKVLAKARLGRVE